MRKLVKTTLLPLVVILLLFNLITAEPYVEKTVYETSGYIYEMVEADFNGDSLLDIAAANTAGYMTVLLSSGSGFLPAVDYPSGGGSKGVCAGYFNGDTFIDIAVSNKSDSSISYFINNGDGTFQSAITVSLQINGPSSIAAGDFNNDTFDDLLVAQDFPIGNRVQYLRNDGAGSFVSDSIIEAGNFPKQIVSGDFNGDDIDDFMVLIYFAGGLWFYPSNGDGTFGTAVEQFTILSFTDNPSSMSVLDFDFDTDLDLVLTMDNFDTGPQFTYTLLNDGSGDFSTMSFVSFLEDFAGAVTAGDYNQDGINDVASVPLYAGYKFSLGIYHGPFSPFDTTFAGNDSVLFETNQYGQYDAVSGDFNNDGCTDVAVATGGIIVYSNFSFSDCCCRSIRGNWDGDANDEINIADIVKFIELSFICGSHCVFTCYEEVDVDASGSINIADLVYLVYYMFGNGPAPLPCSN